MSKKTWLLSFPISLRVHEREERERKAILELRRRRTKSRMETMTKINRSNEKDSFGEEEQGIYLETRDDNTHTTDDDDYPRK
ncbi:hypothetical protein RHMOL_Rhmol08G0184700 [Rhododendron molle]|uniref:Uncharacterized protein n=1 Tax=Rhododendron molle TaxID=49168 RepID=A0ACC0MQ15_RHOML|nr:hypothetical protein RHMOL_Rhmol08G0184700 [Rhododendron molle]